MSSPDPLADLTLEIRQKWGKHEEWLHEHGQILSEMQPNTELLTWLVAEMRGHVDVLLAEIPEEQKHPPICWATTSAEDAEKIWPALAAWVRDILVARFHPSRRELLDCWPLHVGAVENLLWLRRSWLLMFAPRANQNLAAEWYTRWRADAMRELGEAIVREATTSRSERCSVDMHLGRPLAGDGRQATPVEPPQLQRPSAPAPGYGVQLPPGVDPNAPGAQQWTQARMPIPTGPVKVVERGDDLAAAEYWWPQYERARDADLAERRERELVFGEAHAAEQEAAHKRLAQRYAEEDGGPPQP
ncbi:hypothetical protein [Amycolatopsis thailandensis]|uniref:hypothetical protein n=1 Tax=Amycolatopsis thailandensis TaxID=589330 RepID=UPI003639123E